MAGAKEEEEEEEEEAAAAAAAGGGEDLSVESVRSALEACDLDVVMALRTLEAVEKDAQAVAHNLSSLLSSLQSALSQVTTSSVEHLQCYNEVAGRVQEAALDAATKGNRFVNACLRINEEMKGMTGMAAQLRVLRQTVDHFDRQVGRLLPRS